MGRRKIAIEPIKNERNRSVTLQKRKAGLLKKAYELGVLCSVDIAVIIFEERPNHRVKLYQYASSNIDRIVQRQTKYRGETDTLGPADFGGAEYVQDDDEDEEDAHEEDVRPAKRARRVAGPRDDQDDEDDSQDNRERRGSNSHGDSKHGPPSFDFLRALAGDAAYNNLAGFNPSAAGSFASSLPPGFNAAQYAALAHQAALARQAAMLPSSSYRPGPSRGATHPTSSERGGLIERGGVPNISDRALLNAERMALAAERERHAALTSERERSNSDARFQIPSPVSRPGTAGPDLDWALLAARAGGGGGLGGSGGSGPGGGGGGGGALGLSSTPTPLSVFNNLPSLPFGVGAFDGDTFDGRGGGAVRASSLSDARAFPGPLGGGGDGFKPGIPPFEWPPASGGGGSSRRNSARDGDGGGGGGDPHGEGKDDWLNFLSGGGWPVKQEAP
ncbi:hypothetical protein EV121DRAFT_264031 [Schizophyllum commune]